MRFLPRILGLLAAAAVVLLSATNRQDVTFSLDPFWSDPNLVVTAPFYVVVFAAVAVGVVLATLLRPARRPNR
ncbi:MAG: hypothetical protein AAGF49_00730 [Pseudomonadota bacterium]